MKKKRGKSIEDMTDAEWEKHLDEVAISLGWSPEVIPHTPTPDPRYTETRHGQTPSGGDFSIAYYYDKNGDPCPKDEAVSVNIVEYTKEGRRINETYGILG